MSEPERFEVLILGSGFGGKLLAWHMAQSGRRTAVVERRWIGGSCPNIACLPSKNEIWGAKIAHQARHAAQFGTMITGPITTDMAKVRQRKRDMVEREIELHLHNYRTTGAELIMGSARFVAPKTLEVRLNDGGTRVLAGDQVFLNLGTHALIPAIPGLEAARPLTHIEALELDYAPTHLVVLGGGYVGLELAQAYRRFGSRVTVIETGSQLMAREDPDVVDEVHRILRGEGIQFLFQAQTLNIQGRSGDGVSLTVRPPSGEQKIEGSDILAAGGVFRTLRGSGWRNPASSWTLTAISASTTGWRRRHPTPGRSASAPAARSLRMSRSMIFGSSGTIWLAGTAARATGWCPIACLPSRRSLASD
jgi:pyruvate/2-oxoglutarate dehydrogenase complex dihydrolipoamide dehydrogenase (E3) component